MGSRLRLVSAMAVLLGAVSGVATAGVPDPALSEVPNVVTSPDASLSYQIEVEGTEGLIDSALVQIVFSPEAAGLICWCTGQTQPLIQGYTNASGIATFIIEGGGCINPDSVGSPPAVQVFANGILLKEVGVVSADLVDASGKLPHQSWSPGVNCSEDLADGVFITPSISLGFYEFCTDLNSDLAVDLSDAVLFTPPIATGTFCVQAP